LHILPPEVVDDLVQDGVRNFHLAELAGKHQVEQTVEVHGLNFCLRKDLKQFAKDVVDSTDSQAELDAKAQILIVHAAVFLKLVDNRVDILVEQVLHSVAHELFSLFLAVGESSQANHLALVDVEGSPQHLDKVSGCASNQVKVLLPVNKVSLHDLRLAEDGDVEPEVFADRGVEVTLWAELRSDQVVLLAIKRPNFVF
jgi:hypothetical protein